MSSSPPSSRPIAPDPLPNSPNSLMTMPETSAPRPRPSATSTAESRPQSLQASAAVSHIESNSQSEATSSPAESKPQSPQSESSTSSPQTPSRAGQNSQLPQNPPKLLLKPEDIPYYGFRSWISSGFTATFLGGGIAGAVSRTIVSPLERLKILLQVQNVGRDEYKMSISKALGKMWREEGWRGMMAGNGTNCIRIVPYSAVQFASYNVYKKVRLIDSLTCRHADTFGQEHLRSKMQQPQQRQQ